MRIKTISIGGMLGLLILVFPILVFADQFKVYKMAKYGISISFPDNWNVIDKEVVNILGNNDTTLHLIDGTLFDNSNIIASITIRIRNKNPVFSQYDLINATEEGVQTISKIYQDNLQDILHTSMPQAVLDIQSVTTMRICFNKNLYSLLLKYSYENKGKGYNVNFFQIPFSSYSVEIDEYHIGDNKIVIEDIVRIIESIRFES